MVSFEHHLRHFKPEDCKESNFGEIVLTVDELEAMRLSFLENLFQIEAAERMGVHQSTFQRALRRALEKITEAFIYGKSIKIEGGNYRMPGKDGIGPVGNGPGVGRGRGRNRGGGNSGPEGTCKCPKCEHEIPHKPGVPCIEMKCEKCGTSMVRK